MERILMCNPIFNVVGFRLVKEVAAALSILLSTGVNKNANCTCIRDVMGIRKAKERGVEKELKTNDTFIQCNYTAQRLYKFPCRRKRKGIGSLIVSRLFSAVGLTFELFIIK